MKTETLSFKTTEKMKEKLSERAEKEMRSNGSLLRKITRQYLESEVKDNNEL